MKTGTPFFSELTRERWRKFKTMRRAYFALWILGGAFILSLFSEFIANSKPLYLRYEGKSHFPIVRFYSSATFGGEYGTEADYTRLRNDPEFRANGFMLRPPIPHSPIKPNLDLPGTPPHAPSSLHWLGTDNIGRDILARLIYGFRTSMLFSLLLALCAAVLGIVIGGVQGFKGGKIDIITQRLVEIWSALPFLYVVILLGSIYGSSFWLLLFAMSIFGWIGMSYYVRAEFLKLKTLNYVRVARALGLGPVRIFSQEILPNALTPVITLLPFIIVSGISSLTALDFLGFGLPPPAPSWGEMLSQGLDNLHAPWIALSTVAALFFTLLLATFVGEGIREAFDPKSTYRVE